MNGGGVELHAGLTVTETHHHHPPVGFGAMEDDNTNTDPALAVNEWLHHGDHEINFLGVMNHDDAAAAATAFCDGDFLPLPDFPCMTSSSSSSSHSMEAEAPPPPPPLLSTLSSTASMEISSQSPQQPLDHQALNGGDCMQEDATEPFGFLDLWDNNDFFFDPDSIFLPNNDIIDQKPLLFQEEQPQPPQPTHQESPEEEGGGGAHNNDDEGGNNNGEESSGGAGGGGPDGELSSVFFEWLKTNKDSVSASVLRGVKLNRATVECAAKRLGGGKEAMKRLLKLILEWVQICHLQKKNQRNNDDNAPSIGAGYSTPNSFNQSSPWFAADPYANGVQNMLESANSWPHSQFSVANSHYNQYHYQFQGQGDHRWRKLGPLATKEARKKRMARQRKCLSHHRSHSNHNGQSQSQIADPTRMATDNCTALVGAAHANVPANWVYWQAMAAGAAAPPMMMMAADPPPALADQSVDRMTGQSQNYHQGRGSSDRRSQGWKHEKNLKFLLQKVLKQSDVGSLGRIVLPKKEAETHLPELEARDGISIEMEDIGTSRVWNMRYRYWPNNKSRMYLLENTGDFVRANGLQEGDFIVIYSDMKCGKFMIRGVKVRQAGTKAETKKAGKSQKNPHGNTAAANTAGNGANSNGTASLPQQKMGN